jgi:hypothetical protein
VGNVLDSLAHHASKGHHRWRRESLTIRLAQALTVSTLPFRIKHDIYHPSPAPPFFSAFINLALVSVFFLLPFPLPGLLNPVLE